MPHTPPVVPAFTKWPSFPFEGEFRVKDLEDPVAVEPPRKGEGTSECISCNAPDDAYIWISERWRVRAMDRPSGLPIVLILESRSHLDLGDLPNLLAAELGVMTVRLERAIRSLDGVARVHVNRWGDGSAHLHMWFLARPYGRLQLRGTFLSLWDDILPPIPESQWRENLALVAAWLAEFGGRPLAEPPRIQWQAPSSLTQQEAQAADALQVRSDPEPGLPDTSTDVSEDASADAPADSTAERTTGSTDADLSPAGVARAGETSIAEPTTIPPGADSTDAGSTDGGAAAPHTNGEQTDAVRADATGPRAERPEDADSSDRPDSPEGSVGSAGSDGSRASASSPGEAPATEAATRVPATEARPFTGGAGNPAGPVADATSAGRREAEGGLPVPR